MKNRANYMVLPSYEAELEAELEKIKHLYYRVEDEEEADALYGEEIAELEHELEEVRGDMYNIEKEQMTQDYYASVL